MRRFFRKSISILLLLSMMVPLMITAFAVETRAAVSDEVLEQHTVEGVSPDGVMVNLFDYWVDNEISPTGDILSKESEAHPRQFPSAWGNTAKYSGPDNWNRGINTNHLLIFGDGIAHAGIWNKGAGESTQYGKKYAGMEGIVKSTLHNGYPVINTDMAREKLIGNKDKRNWEDISDWKVAGTHQTGVATYNDYKEEGIQNLNEIVIENWQNATGQTLENGIESLDYLFNPDKKNSYKKSYRNIKDLFQIDDEGYYYYNMRENFAEFTQDTSGVKDGESEDKRDIKSEGRFILYDAPATVRTDAANTVGNFFPFNKGKEVFDGVDGAGNLTSSVACSGNSMNHHMGMTVDVDFRQTLGGMVNQGKNGTQPMTFQFSGDDDVWVYIDDTLILDLGGVHSEIYGIIDFASGDVVIGRGFESNGIPDYDHNNPGATQGLVTKTTLRQLYKDAGMENTVDWSGNTFASNTDHKLKMFYLERGNYDSSLSFKFNLMPLLYQQIKKVDQDGNPMEGVEFALYEAALDANGKPIKNNDGKYQTKGNSLTTLTTDKDGISKFVETEKVSTALSSTGTKERPFNFEDRYSNNGTEYYVLKETKTPPGYRSLPIDIVLQYNNKSTMLVVTNRYATGAYSSFTSNIQGNKNVTYGSFDTATGVINPSATEISSYEQENGLVVAIPMLYQQNLSKWEAMYGSNTNGFKTKTPEDRTAVSWRKAALIASLAQCADNRLNAPHWYLEWDQETKRLEGNLSDLPGRADRYQISNPDGDMRMGYAIINSSVFDKLNIKATNSKERYEALGIYIRSQLDNGKTIEDVANEIYATPSGDVYEEDGSYEQRGFSFMNVDQFARNFRSLIYIPNEQRELRVLKVDQNGQAVNGVKFQIVCVSDDPAINGTVAATGITAKVDGKEGALIFEPSPPMKDDNTAEDGYAKIEWARSSCDRYYLQEVSAPSGYKINDTKIPIVVGIYSIYADAGDEDNGVSVMAGVGKLTQTMVKYASDEKVNITLRDITAYGQVQQSGKFDLYGWNDMTLNGTSDVKRSMNLHYGKNAVVSYGLHDEDGGKNFYPFFVTDEGFIRARVNQNYEALTENSTYGDSSDNTANKDKIDEDITGLFSLLNIVVVTDKNEKNTNTGQLTISKTVAGKDLTEKDYMRYFEFDVDLKDKSGNDLPGEYYFFGTDKSGYIKNGDKILLHHDESITILGLPKGTKYKVTEKELDDWYTIPDHVQQGVIEKDKESIAGFINSNVEVVQVKGTKVWKDNDNKDGLRPDTITLYVKNKKTGDIVDTITLSSGRDKIWQENELNFASKALYKYDNGKKIEYILEEKSVDNYKSSITGNMRMGFKVVNTHNSKSSVIIDPNGGGNGQITVKTADCTNLRRYGTIAIVSLIAFMLIALTKRREMKKDLKR